MKITLDVNQQLGSLMKAMRMSIGARQEDVSKAIGISRGQLANIENGAMCNILLQHIVNYGDCCGFDVVLTVRKRKNKRKR